MDLSCGQDTHFNVQRPGKLQHLELALPGGVQPRKPGAAEASCFHGL